MVSKRTLKTLGYVVFIIGVLFLVGVTPGITGFAVFRGDTNSSASYIYGVVLVIIGIGLFYAGRKRGDITSKSAQPEKMYG